MKRILTSKEYRLIKGLKELMTKYNAVISTDAQGKMAHPIIIGGMHKS